MKVSFIRKSGPEYMIPAMRATTGKDMKTLKRPTLETWYKMLISGHSSPRAVEYRVFCEDVPYFVHVHFARHHVGVQFHVKSQRSVELREDLPQGTLIDFFFDANPQALINIARARLCFNADEQAQSLVKKLKCSLVYEGDEYDKVLGNLLMKPCSWYRGFCAEVKSCGRVANITQLSEIHYQALEKEV